MAEDPQGENYIRNYIFNTEFNFPEEFKEKIKEVLKNNDKSHILEQEDEDIPW
jgi:hypothetical protein